MPQPRPLLHATNAVLGVVRPRHDAHREWDRLLQRCGAAFGFVPAGPELEALHQLLLAAAAEPDLSPMGRYSFAQVHVWPRLRNVAQVQQLHAAHPEIADENVDDPVFVVGMPRTATTVTHQLLASAAGRRGPLMAEMYSSRLQDPTAAEVRRAARQIKQLARYEPYFEDIHPLSATAPEETFFCEVASRYFMCSAPLPGYRRWLDEQDAVPWYQWLRRVLQVLQYGRDPQGQRRRWVLKQPGHLWQLPQLLQVFPRATVVWTHREPETVFGSTCSMIEAMRRMHLHSRVFAPGGTGLADIGELWLDLLAEAVERGRNARAVLPADTVVDVPYHRLTSDPETTLPLLWGRLGMDWTPDDQGRLKQAFRRRNTDRRHEYTCSRYGKSDDQVRNAFKDYPAMVAQMNVRLGL